MSKELIVAAHPDDELLGCGGTMIKLLDQGQQLGVLYLSSGDSNEELREKEARDVCSSLGIEKYYFLRLKGESFAVTPANIAAIAAVFSDYRPDYLFANHKDDSDFEHKIAYQLVNEAFWRFNIGNPDSVIRAILLYEVHKPMDEYSIVEDITTVADRKLAALSLYRSQLEISAIDKAILGLNRYRGTLHESCDFAEMFQLKRFRNFSEIL